MLKEELCKDISCVETSIKDYRKKLNDIETKINSMNKGCLTREETLIYLSYKEDRKIFGQKIGLLKDIKKNLSRQLNDLIEDTVKGECCCFKKEPIKFIVFNGDNMTDVFKFSHSTNYVFENETLKILGKNDLTIHIGEYMVFDEIYKVFTEKEFKEKYYIE